MAVARDEQRGTNDTRVLLDLTPGPDGGGLVVEVECRTRRDAATGARHEITIESDWTVTTPHDMEAERVAVAFGGYTSCLTLIDTTVPAFRASLPLLIRRERPVLRRDARGAWRLPTEDQIRECCHNRAFPTVEKLARHLRSAPHLIAAHDVPPWQFEQVMTGAAQAWATWDGLGRDNRLAALVREPGGVRELWRCGIRPDEIVELAEYADLVDQPLPIAYYTGLAYGNGDPDWVRKVLRHRPDPDVAAWLAHFDQEQRTGNPDHWGRWLAYGMTRDEVRAMTATDVDPDLVDEIAAVTGWSTFRTARTLVAWIRVGARPSAADFEVLARHRATEVRFASETIDAIRDEIGSLVRDSLWGAVALTRTEIGIMFAVLRNRPAVLLAARAGVRGSAGLDQYIEARDSVR